MVNRERFMLDVDSEGFPQRYDDVPHPPATLAGINVGRSADHAIVQALLADHKCLQCEPVDKIIPATDYTFIEQRALAWAEEARELVREADQRMDGLSLPLLPDGPFTDGVKRLSDSAAPDAYFGWKS